jgi:hypothetical protein
MGKSAYLFVDVGHLARGLEVPSYCIRILRNGGCLLEIEQIWRDEAVIGFLRHNLVPSYRFWIASAKKDSGLL